MTAYEFYSRDEREGIHSIGILPERRRLPERITPESIMDWGRIILGEDLDLTDLFFIQIAVDDSGTVSYPISHFESEREG